MVTTLVETTIEAFTGIVSGVGSGISELFTSIFMTGTGETASISALGIFVLAMLGISMATSIVYYILRLIRRRG